MQSVNLIADARFSDDKANALHVIKTDQLVIDAHYLKAGQTTGWGKSPDTDQAFLCLQGQGELVLETAAIGNELRIPLGLGAIALAPRGVFHQLVAGSQGMICSAITRFPHRVIEKG